jgi:hypothetical protein
VQVLAGQFVSGSKGQNWLEQQTPPRQVSEAQAVFPRQGLPLGSFGTQAFMELQNATLRSQSVSERHVWLQADVVGLQP